MKAVDFDYFLWYAGGIWHADVQHKLGLFFGDEIPDDLPGPVCTMAGESPGDALSEALAFVEVYDDEGG